MPFTGNQNTTFPAVPPSLSAGGHGMRDFYNAAQDTIRPASHTVPQITPYLGLRARLSQVVINRWTVLLILVLVRILFAISGLHHNLDSAKIEALSACSSVESMGSAMASMPHYMSQGVNELAATGVEKAVNGLMSMLLLSITGVEEIIVFYINMLTSTYVCLITLAVSGSLHAAIKVAEDVGDFLNKTLGDIKSDISNGINGFQTDLNHFADAFNNLPGIGSVPKIDVTSSLDKLGDLTLPSTLDEGLQKLNSSIPTFSEVQNFTNTAIRFPFEEVKKLMNDSMTAFKFNRSVFPVPQKEQVRFCSDNNGISDFFDGIANTVNLARRAFIGVLVVFAILVCIPMAWREIRRWRKMQQRARLINDGSYEPLDVIYIASRPYTAAAGIKVSSKFTSTKKRHLTRWVIAYATSTPALLVLSLGVTGLLACLCQLILLKSVEKEVPALANEVGEFAGKVVNVLNNASEQWAVGTNRVIGETNNDINNNVFGWVNTTTGAVNHTLNLFVDETTKVLNDTFGGTVLHDPIQGVFDCLIGLKIAGIQKGLDWVSDNAQVNFPLFDNDTFSLGAAASLASDQKDTTESFLASPGSEATDKITGAINRVTAFLEDGIRTEAIISSFLILLWFIIALVGLVRALILACKHDKLRGEGGPSFAGDIPLAEPARPYSSAAPAYEPPRAPEAAVRIPNFGNLSGDGRIDRNSIDGDWQDQKLGFAGERGPADRIPAGHTRTSSYGHLEKH
ncbi:plasma membrane fusion protein prm1 [Pseudocyphellaria aurata]|nr:plasma membrane fusion protein prm1 [Pseudocyphellaria aurata]